MNVPPSFIDISTPTSLMEYPELARLAGVARVIVKAESERPLGNFKVLGGMVAALRILERSQEKRGSAHRPVLVCASAGNHGLAVAAAARSFGVPAKVFLAHSVDERRVARITSMAAEVVRTGGTYDGAVDAARQYCRLYGGMLIADTTADPHDPVVEEVMRGYGRIVDELSEQLPRLNSRPTHLYVQAGVGGLAAAMATGLVQFAAPVATLVVVEPKDADCVGRALQAGRPVTLEGGLDTAASMLACGLASAPALATLLQHKAVAMTVLETELEEAAQLLASMHGPATTASGVTGLAGFLVAARSGPLHGLDRHSEVLLLVTEGPL